MTDQENMKAAVPDAARRYMRYLLIMAGLGGLLYGVDVGVIAAALPYIEQTAGFNPSQLSQVVAAVLFGSVLSSLFAGYLADKMGRKALITVAAALFTASIPVICLSQEVFGIMLLGRILQGASAGIVGVVVPLYLAECLSAECRRRRFACRQLCGRRREFRRERRIADFRQGSGLAGYFLGLRHSRPVPVFRFLPFERISPLPVPPRPQG